MGSDCLTAFTAVDGVNTATGSPEWWLYTVPGDGILNVSSVGSGEDTQLGLFSSCLSFFGSYTDGDLGSNDDYGSPLLNQFESELTINVYSGMSIYIYWDDQWSSNSFDFNITFSAAVLGCTDSTAVNYDPTATADDGSCFYPIFGCTDPLAFNFDPFATADDSSCTYCTGNVLTVDMADSFGDGWNGNVLSVADTSGNVVATATLTTGSCLLYTSPSPRD